MAVATAPEEPPGREARQAAAAAAVRVAPEAVTRRASVRPFVKAAVAARPLNALRECEAGFAEAGSGIDFDSCPSELNALGNCLGANNCDNDQCGPEFTAYILCVAGIAF